jgi:hypothetical protein
MTKLFGQVGKQVRLQGSGRGHEQGAQARSAKIMENAIIVVANGATLTNVKLMVGPVRRRVNQETLAGRGGDADRRGKFS